MQLIFAENITLRMSLYHEADSMPDFRGETYP